MKITPERNKQIRGNILYLFGVAWVTFFALAKPEALDKYWVFIIGLSWFGSGFIAIVRGTQGKKRDDDDDF